MQKDYYYSLAIIQQKLDDGSLFYNLALCELLSYWSNTVYNSVYKKVISVPHNIDFFSRIMLFQLKDHRIHL